MLSSICTLRKKYVLLFFLIAVIRNRIVVVFWSLNLSILLWKIYLSFLRLLSVVCFRDLFELRFLTYLRAIDSPVRFLSLPVVWPFWMFRPFLTFSNVFNNTKFCCILFLLVPVDYVSTIRLREVISWRFYTKDNRFRCNYCFVFEVLTIRVASIFLPAMFLRFFFYRKYYSFRRCFDLNVKVSKIAVWTDFFWARQVFWSCAAFSECLLDFEK